MSHYVYVYSYIPLTLPVTKCVATYLGSFILVILSDNNLSI